MKSLSIWSIILLVFALSPQRLPAEETHQTFRVRGWTVHVHLSRLPPHSTIGDDVVAVLGEKFEEIEQRVPGRALTKLREVPFWIMDQEVDGAAMAYHPSRKWLEDHHLDGRMAKGVEIRRPEEFLQESFQKTQPYSVLHELAHGYHHAHLGWQNTQIQQTFDHAVESGRYQQVAYRHYQRDSAGNVILNEQPSVRAYALSNSHEYFAELSEAYFGQNDFFPFNREELREYDPEGERLMALWDQ